MWSRPWEQAKEYVIHMKNGRGLAFGIRWGSGGPAESLFLLNFEEQNHSFPWLVRTFLLSSSPFLPPSTKRTKTVKQQESLHAPCRKPIPNYCWQSKEIYLSRVSPSWLKRILQKQRAWYGPLISFCSLCSFRTNRRDRRRQQLAFTKTIIFSHKECPLS